MKCLFVGGSRDGEMIDIHADLIKLGYIVLPKRASVFAMLGGELTEETSYETEQYVRHRLRDTDTTEHIIFMPLDSGHMPIAMLIKGYGGQP
jgi:hypothetical protein